MEDDALRIITEHREVWKRKKVLRTIYNGEFFARLKSFRRPDGVSVEVGGGPGFLKESVPDIISTDLVWCPWLDLIADAHQLPFDSESISNLLGLDVLHHLEDPIIFLKEAERVLSKGGRLILIEPWITPFSYFIYRYLHQEDCDLTALSATKKEGARENSKRAFDGNAAIPYLLFGTDGLQRTRASFPHLTPVRIEPFCLFGYLLSLGFKRINLLPEVLYPLVRKVEQASLPIWRSLAALRVFLVLEKS